MFTPPGISGKTPDGLVVMEPARPQGVKMKLDDGTFMPTDEFNRLVKEAVIVEITCPRCKDMTCTEPLGDNNWLCYECGMVFAM